MMSSGCQPVALPSGHTSCHLTERAPFAQHTQHRFYRGHTGVSSESASTDDFVIVVQSSGFSI